jgi:hypothetical protein
MTLAIAYTPAVRSTVAIIAMSALVAGLSACAPVVRGGAPMPLMPGLMETATVNTITISTGWLNVEDDFADTFTDEVREELETCAYGNYPLTLRVHVDEVHRASRVGVLLNGDGLNTLAATAELVDPAHGDRVVGRFPIVVGAPAGGRVAGVLGDRQMMVSEQWGRALCDQAFGRNPRQPGPHNATRG